MTPLDERVETWPEKWQEKYRAHYFRARREIKPTMTHDRAHHYAVYLVQEEWRKVQREK